MKTHYMTDATKILANEAITEIHTIKENPYKEIESGHFTDEQFQDVHRQFEKEKAEREKQNLNDQLHKIRGKSIKIFC